MKKRKTKAVKRGSIKLWGTCHGNYGVREVAIFGKSKTEVLNKWLNFFPNDPVNPDRFQKITVVEGWEVL